MEDRVERPKTVDHFAGVPAQAQIQTQAQIQATMQTPHGQGKAATHISAVKLCRYSTNTVLSEKDV